jgi:hypothetical protein
MKSLMFPVVGDEAEELMEAAPRMADMHPFVNKQIYMYHVYIQLV